MAAESGHGNDLIPLGGDGIGFRSATFLMRGTKAARGRLDKYLERMIDAEAAMGWYRASQALLSQWPAACGPQLRRPNTQSAWMN